MNIIKFLLQRFRKNSKSVYRNMSEWQNGEWWEFDPDHWPVHDNPKAEVREKPCNFK